MIQVSHAKKRKKADEKRISHLELPFAFLIAAALELFEEQLILGDPLNGFDEVGADGVLDVVSLLNQLEELHSTVLDEHGVGFLHVFTIVDVDVELLGLSGRLQRLFIRIVGRRQDDKLETYPSDKAMADIFRHGFVLLELLEEDILVEFKNLFHVGEEHFLFADQGRLGSKLVALVVQCVEVILDADLQVLHVRLLRLQQLRHNEPGNK